MKTSRLRRTLAVIVLAVCLLSTCAVAQEQLPDEKKSYYYYGPNGLYRQWKDKNDQAAAQRLGRDTWIHWTWGNQKVLRKAAVLAGNLPVPVSIDLFRLLDSRNRGSRFKDLGLINEPNCKANTTKPEFGLYLDTFEGDPYVKDNPNGYYPVDRMGQPNEAYIKKYYPKGKAVDLRHFGRPSGIVGVRLFDNPMFDRKKWDVKEYFKNPGKVEPPFLVGFSCAFCHIAFNPNNPPKDPENPEWENLAANMGNQYLREGELFLGKGRIVFGDKNPDPRAPDDPYQTKGLTENDFLYHYAVTQQLGTSETSRFSYDFINNPNTINPLFGLKYRPVFVEETPAGRLRIGKQRGWHALKDGADAIGIEWALMRVPLNIGCEGDYWIDRLFNPGTGRKQHPVRLLDLLTGLTSYEKLDVEDSLGVRFPRAPEDRLAQAVRQAELKERFRSPYRSKVNPEEFGDDYKEAWRRIPALASYLLSYEPFRLTEAKPTNPDDIKAVKNAIDAKKAQRGARVFGIHCAKCHSSKQPSTSSTKEDFFEGSAQAPFFLLDNYLSDERRYPVTQIGTNMARSLGTNAIEGDVWAEFSSKEYKALPPVGRVVLDVPVFGKDQPWLLQPPLRIEFEPPGGGRGYYRTASLLSLWATAPYLHNNSVGDYLVVKKDKDGKQVKEWVPNDGRLITEQIDVSVDGRLKMFEDGMRKLLNPAKRRHWVKRTSADSALIPDLNGTIRQLVAGVASDGLRQAVSVWLSENRDIPLPPEALLKAVDIAFQRAVLQDLAEREKSVDPNLVVTALFARNGTLGDISLLWAIPPLIPGRVSLDLAWARLHQEARTHALYLFDLTFEQLKRILGEQDPKAVARLEKVKLVLRNEFAEQLKTASAKMKDSLGLTIPKGYPVNLYANLNAGALPHAVIAHFRHRDDPRAFAETLLRLSDCPDLVEDHGHTFGWNLSDADKDDLIEFLKTF